MNIKATTDLGLAAALISNGFRIEEVDRSNSKRVRFVFEGSYELDRAIDSYWSDTFMVSGRVMMESIKYLKNRIYA